MNYIQTNKKEHATFDGAKIKHLNYNKAWVY